MGSGGDQVQLSCPRRLTRTAFSAPSNDVWQHVWSIANQWAHSSISVQSFCWGSASHIGIEHLHDWPWLLSLQPSLGLQEYKKRHSQKNHTISLNYLPYRDVAFRQAVPRAQRWSLRSQSTVNLFFEICNVWVPPVCWVKLLLHRQGDKREPKFFLPTHLEGKSWLNVLILMGMHNWQGKVIANTQFIYHCSLLQESLNCVYFQVWFTKFLSEFKGKKIFSFSCHLSHASLKS